MALLPRPGGQIFSPYRPSKRGIFIIWLTRMLQKIFLSYKYPVRVVFTSKRTVHNFLQFEKVEWNKLVQAEIKARKYVLEITEQFRRGKLNSLVPNKFITLKAN